MKKVISVLMSILAVCLMFSACSNKDNNIELVQAEELVKLYSAEELGVTEEQLAAAQYFRDNAVHIFDGKEYYSIVLGAMVQSTEPDEEGRYLYSMNAIATCYVSLDGKGVFLYDSETDSLNQLGEKEVPTLSPQQASQLAVENETTTERATINHDEEETTADDIPSIPADHTHEHTHE